MKKVSIWVLVAVVLAATCVLGFSNKKNVTPSTYYQVYLEGKLLGTISSKTELEDYIDRNGEYYKNKYHVSKVYAPESLQIKKNYTYSGDVISVQDIYKKIKKKDTFTIKGYQFVIKHKDDKDKIKNIKINVLNKNVFKKAVTTLINTYVGKDNYDLYLEDNQMKFDTTGETIENVYIEEDITVKEVNIPVDDKIFTDDTELSKYLLYGEDTKDSMYSVKAGDTVDSVAFANKVSPEELLLSNDSLTSTSNLLYPGQQLKIVETSPKISVVEESYVVKDVESRFKTEEKYDSTLLVGDEKVTQEGQKGLERVSQRVKAINGTIVYVDPLGKQVLKSPINKVVIKGSKYVSGVGSL
ncbi:MAG: LysM peptidoglycan-binding domain-containing protein, partial [Bacilli bacterium]|nr:LysM peptidoglycan-binding domain-containing protein [Bacilli bacterium]